MKKIKTLIITVLALMLVWGFAAHAGSIQEVDNSVSGGSIPLDMSMDVKVDSAPVFDYGKSGTVEFAVTFKDNLDDENITDVRFRPITSNDSVTYPFEIKNDEVEIAKSIGDGDTVKKNIEFEARENVVSGYRTINYEIYFTYKGKEYKYTDSFTVNINGNPEADDPNAGTEESTTSDPSEQNDIKISVGVNQSTPVCVYGQPVELTLTFLNNGGNTANGVVVRPVVDADSNIFPFEIQQMDYSRNLETLLGTGLEKDPNNRMKSVTYSLVTRQKVTTGYKKVSFQIDYYTDALIDKSITKDIYVMVQGNPEMDAQDSEGEEGKTSVPRVIVSGYTTNPEEIFAGDSFEITMQMTNTSKLTAVSNLVFDIQSENFNIDENATAAAFLPVSGSSTIYVDKIGPGETKDISIEMTARTDLSPRPYVLNVKMNYEDAKKNPYEATASVSVPVKQQDKIELSTPEVMPESINVGSQANIMFNIYNTGKTKLYNVMVRFKGDSISETECFVGNVDAGATGSVDAMLTGMAATMDDGTLIAEISYENQSGEVMTLEKEYTLFVSEYVPTDDIMMGGDMMGMEGMEEEGGISPALIAVIVIVVLAAVAGVIVFLKKKKKKALELQESEGLDEI